MSAEERGTLEHCARRQSSSQALALRCKIVLAAAEGQSNKDIAARLGCHPSTVGKWRDRFVTRRLEGLHDNPRPGKPRKLTDVQVKAVVVKTLEESPPDGGQWSTRSMARATGLSQTAISRIWRAHGIKLVRDLASSGRPDDVRSLAQPTREWTESAWIHRRLTTLPDRSPTAGGDE